MRDLVIQKGIVAPLVALAKTDSSVRKSVQQYN